MGRGDRGQDGDEMATLGVHGGYDATVNGARDGVGVDGEPGEGLCGGQQDRRDVAAELRHAGLARADVCVPGVCDNLVSSGFDPEIQLNYLLTLLNSSFGVNIDNAHLATSMLSDWSKTLPRTFLAIFGGEVDQRSFLRPCKVYHHIWTAWDTFSPS